MQVEWVCEFLGPADALATRIVLYTGLFPCGLGASLEALLQAKCCVLIAITIKRRSLRQVSPTIIRSL